jgi:tubulin epsilon
VAVLTQVVFPSADDDVVTSPYNSVLAIQRLNEHADCVLPVDNAALLDMIQHADRSHSGGLRAPAGPGRMPGEANVCGGVGGGTPFETMNNVIARILLSLTASMRFDGALRFCPCAPADT